MSAQFQRLMKWVSRWIPISDPYLTEERAVAMQKDQAVRRVLFGSKIGGEIYTNEDRKVYVVKHQRKTYALKEVMLADDNADLSSAEFHVFLTLQDAESTNPFLLQLHDGWFSDCHAYFVSEMAKGGDLMSQLILTEDGKFSQERAIFYAAEIGCAVGHLHELGILHNDLKLANIFLAVDGHILVGDFESAEMLIRTEYPGFLRGTIGYIAPEKLTDDFYGFPADWFSYGVVVYEMLTGKPAFQKSIVPPYDILNDIYSCGPNFVMLEEDGILSEEGVSFCSSLLEMDPRFRLGTKGDFEEIKEHMFFTSSSIDFERLLKKDIDPPYIPGKKKQRTYVMTHCINSQCVRPSSDEYEVAEID